VSGPENVGLADVPATLGWVAVERVFFCDGPDCERHVRTAMVRPSAGYLFVTEGGSDLELHFCTWDCVLKYAAAKPPTEVIALDA
jgi:hypothetical protein